MSKFEPALAYVLKREGGLEKPGSDPGGITNFGISFRFLKSVPPERLRMYGLPIYITAETIEQLTPPQVSALYKGEFWNVAPFALINNQDIANYLFDACVNLGIAPGVKCLQRALWSCRNIRGSLLDDGVLGPLTIKNINSTDGVYLLAAFRSERGGEYRLIAQHNPKEQVDLDGWLKRAYNQST